MFLKKYINELYYDLIIDNYKDEYLKLLNEETFLKIYKLLVEYNFYFIEDIILKYLEIFEMDYDVVKEKIELLKNRLGDNFVSLIGNNMSYLNDILE